MNISSRSLLLTLTGAALALSCARPPAPNIAIALPEKLAALSAADAAQVQATIEISGFLAETALTISSDQKSASGTFTVAADKQVTAPFTIRVTWHPDDTTSVLLARQSGTVAIAPHKDNALNATAAFDTCGALAPGEPCSLEFNLNRNQLANLDDLARGFDPRPPPAFADTAPSDLAFASGIRLGTFSRQVIVVENTSATPISVTTNLIDAPGATLSPFETDPTLSTPASRALDLGELAPFQEVLVAVSFAPVNPFLTVGDVFVEAKGCPLPTSAQNVPACTDDAVIDQATRVRLLANVDGELQPPPAGFVAPALPSTAGLAGFSGDLEAFPTTSLFNGLPVTSVASTSGAVAGLAFTGSSINATFADGAATVPADHAFVVAVPADHELAVSLAGLASDVDLSVFLLDDSGAISNDPSRNFKAGKAGLSAEAVQHNNDSGADEKALVVIGRVELTPVVATPGALSASDPTPFSLSAHVTSAPEFTAPLDPTGGPLEGGTEVTLRGKRFDSNAQVIFADSQALDCSFSHDDTTNEDVFHCTTPPGSLLVGKNPATIVVANPSEDEGGDGQAATLPEGFTYEPPAPRLDQLVPAVAPTTGTGSDVIVLKGAFFSQRNGPPQVLFDGTAAPNVTFVDSTRLTVPAPAHDAGNIAVDVQNVLDPLPGQTGTHLSLPSNSRDFTFVVPNADPPAVASITPTSGTIDGGDVVNFVGAGLSQGGTILFDGNKAANVTVAPDGTSLSCTTPARTFGGNVVVEVINNDGQRTSVTGGYTYIVPNPSVTSAFPSSAATAGGTFIVISGSGFRDGITVGFDDGTNVTSSPSVNR
ncbi:MAG TPA: IPT/TIG domain-containing protein, partial [Myxococcota bacterium]